MTEKQIREILDGVAAGKMTPGAAFKHIRELPFEDLGFAKLDNHRSIRRGIQEVIFGEGKTADQPEEDENQRRHLAEREFHQRPIPSPRIRGLLIGCWLEIVDLLTISPLDRETLVAFYIQGQSLVEIAEALDDEHRFRPAGAAVWDGGGRVADDDAGGLGRGGRLELDWVRAPDGKRP